MLLLKSFSRILLNFCSFGVNSSYDIEFEVLAFFLQLSLLLAKF
jgi:integrase